MLTITNMRQILPHIQNRPEFIVMDKGDYFVLDYVYQAADTFDSPEAMECRGIKFDREGLILARPFRKFFNYGEQGTHMPLHKPHIITDKLDGSMIHPVMIGRTLFFHTRKGHTDVAKKAERYALSAESSYDALCRDAIKRGWTPIFEYIGPDNRIVLRYDDSDLVLLAMRHTVEGYLMPYKDLREWGASYGVPVVTTAKFTLTSDGYKGADRVSRTSVLEQDPSAATLDLQKFLTHTRELEDAEGYVVYFDDLMVKVKAEDYVLKHRALDDMSSKKKVVALCCQGFADDVLPILNDADKDELLAFNEDLHVEIDKLAMTAQALAAAHGDDRKKFALEVKPNLQPSWLSGVVFGIMDGKNARQLVLKAVERGGYEDIGVVWRGE